MAQLTYLNDDQTHQNYSGRSYLQYKHRVKKLEKFIDHIKSYGRLKFRKNEVFVSKRVTMISRYDAFLLNITLV